VPFRVMDAGPMVTIPVIRASPFTNNVVPDAPTAPKVLIPETLSCCDVKLVADVTPNVEIPETLSC
jgi:hypothetical protein